LAFKEGAIKNAPRRVNFKEIVNLFCILCLSSFTSKAFTTYPLDENERLLVPPFWINLHVIPTIFRDFPI
jgi:hypothetical protein